jgi:hypothetical protein
VSISIEKSEGDGQAAYPPRVVGMESGQENGTGGDDHGLKPELECKRPGRGGLEQQRGSESFKADLKSVLISGVEGACESTDQPLLLFRLIFWWLKTRAGPRILLPPAA